MHRGSYTIQEGYEGGVKGGGRGSGGGVAVRPVDSSFSTCLMALLFFLALCIVIMLAAWPWGRDKPHPTYPEEEGERPLHEGYSGGKATDGPPKGEEHPGRSTGAPSGRPTTHPVDGPNPSTWTPTEEEVAHSETEPPTTGDEEHHHYTTKHPAKGTKTGGHGHPVKGGHRENETDSSEWVGINKPRNESSGKSEKLIEKYGESASEDSTWKPTPEGAKAEIETGESTTSDSSSPTDIPSLRTSATEPPAIFTEPSASSTTLSASSTETSTSSTESTASSTETTVSSTEPSASFSDLLVSSNETTTTSTETTVSSTEPSASFSDLPVSSNETTTTSTETTVSSTEPSASFSDLLVPSNETTVSSTEPSASFSDLLVSSNETTTTSTETTVSSTEHPVESDVRSDRLGEQDGDSALENSTSQAIPAGDKEEIVGGEGTTKHLANGTRPAKGGHNHTANGVRHFENDTNSAEMFESSTPNKESGVTEEAEGGTTHPVDYPGGRKNETLDDSDSIGSGPEREEPKTEDGAMGEESADEEGVAETCETVPCKSLSSHVLALMDHGADPCNDFYAYTCGGMRGGGGQWITEEIPEFEPFSRIEGMKQKINDSSPDGLKKFKKFYEDCLYYDNEVKMTDREETVRDILRRVGKLYNVLDPEPYDGNFTELLGNLLSYHFSPILDVLLDVDLNNNSKFALKLSLPAHKSPFGYLSGKEKQATLRGWQRSTCVERATENPKGRRQEQNLTARYDDYINCTNDLTEYLKEVNVTLQNLNLFGHLNPDNATHNIQEIISSLEEELGKKMQKFMPKSYEKERVLQEKDFMEFRIKDLQEKFTLVEWNALISKLVNEDVPEDTTVHVYFKSYFESIFPAMDVMDGKKLNNALMAMFAHELYHGIALDRNSCSREEYCLFVSVHLMEDASSALFLKSFHPKQLDFFQSKINSTFNELISTLESEVSSIPWLEMDSKDEILDKVSKMSVVADGGASVFLNGSYLDSQFGELEMNSNYLEEAIYLLQRYRKRMYLSFGKNPSEPEQIWSNFLEPYSLHGMAVYGLNLIVVPYGMMGRPFFSEDFPEYFQMAGLGRQIAGEIWHHFDKTGMQYNVDGSKDNFWGTTGIASMKSIASCLEEQKTGEQTADAGDGTTATYELKSGITTSSRLADIGAVHLAHKWAFRDGRMQASLPWSSITPKQLYFLAIAQIYCTKSSIYDYVVSLFESKRLPPFMRVNDIATNSMEFASAFSCPREHVNICHPFTLATAREDEDAMPPPA